jgi:hypothetical protein
VSEANDDTAPGAPGNRARVSRRVVVGVTAAVTVALAAAVVVMTTREGDETATVTTSTTATDQPSTTMGPSSTTTSTTSMTVPASTATSTGSATTAAPPLQGSAGPGCVNGWSAPAPGTALRVEPLDVIRREMGVSGQFLVTEMRYFTGPEVPWILHPRPPFVEWWYVKAQLVDEPAFRARWLVARRSPVVEGITAAARFDTQGYRSPDWRAFIGDSPPHTVEGLPGTWAGTEFDFTTGEDGEKPGLPTEVVHCLDGT